MSCSFTLEASFCGASVGRWAGQHFNTWHLEQVWGRCNVGMEQVWGN